MVIVKASPTFLKNGAIVPTEDELSVIIHALIEERDRVARAHGNQYSPMTIKQVSQLINELEEYRKQGEV